MITGPAGVGKEIAARLLHGWSPRASAPFVVVSAARMTPERVEEELFGVEEGGDLVRPGMLEQAHGGTRSEEHTSELQSLMRTPYDLFCLKNKTTTSTHKPHT